VKTVGNIRNRGFQLGLGMRFSLKVKQRGKLKF